MCVFECVKFTRYVILLLSFIQQMKTRRVCAAKLSFILSRIKNGFYFPIQKYTINCVFLMSWVQKNDEKSLEWVSALQTITIFFLVFFFWILGNSLHKSCTIRMYVSRKSRLSVNVE